MRHSNPVLFLVLASMLCGCGGSDAPVLATVEGTVTWQGAPLADASVAFTPESGPVATGQTDPSGHFTLKTQGQDGASVGTHRVTVLAYEPPPPGKMAIDENGEPTYDLVSKIPEKYSNLEESGLQATVTKDKTKNTYRFDLD